MYVDLHVCMQVYVSVYMCLYVCVYVCLYVCLYVCMYVYKSVCFSRLLGTASYNTPPSKSRLPLPPLCVFECYETSVQFPPIESTQFVSSSVSQCLYQGYVLMQPNLSPHRNLINFCVYTSLQHLYGFSSKTDNFTVQLVVAGEMKST